MYYKTLRQLLWWCALIAIICTGFLLLLMSTPRWIDPTFSLGKVMNCTPAEAHSHVLLTYCGSEYICCIGMVESDDASASFGGEGVGSA